MRVTVTGGAGFIGSRLVRRLQEEGHKVTAVDVRDSDGVVAGDVRNLPRMIEVMTGAQAVYHLAGPVVEGVRKNLYEGLQVQLMGTLTVLEACRRQRRPPKVILASSFYVYAGMPEEAVVNEATPLDVLKMDAFGASKAMSESMVKAYAQAYGLQYVALRFGSAYGFGDCSNVIKTLMEMGNRGEQLEVWGRGARRNQYTYVDDIVEGCLLALTMESTTMNLVAPEETTTGELALMLRDLYGYDVVFNEDRNEGASMAQMVSLNARRGIDWCTTALKDGVERMADEMQPAAG